MKLFLTKWRLAFVSQSGRNRGSTQSFVHESFKFTPSRLINFLFAILGLSDINTESQLFH